LRVVKRVKIKNLARGKRGGGQQEETTIDFVIRSLLIYAA